MLDPLFFSSEAKETDEQKREEVVIGLRHVEDAFSA